MWSLFELKGCNFYCLSTVQLFSKWLNKQKLYAKLGKKRKNKHIIHTLALLMFPLHLNEDGLCPRTSVSKARLIHFESHKGDQIHHVCYSLLGVYVKHKYFMHEMVDFANIERSKLELCSIYSFVAKTVKLQALLYPIFFIDKVS